MSLPDDETALVRRAADEARLDPARSSRVCALARSLVVTVRERRRAGSGMDAFLQEYDLGSKEGVLLLCLAEALLRIPDADTADRLIAEKLAAGDWASHAGESGSLFVNASTWSLMLTGRLVLPEEEDRRDPRPWLARLAGRIGEPVVRAALRQAMRILATQFVMGRDIREAIGRARQEDSAAGGAAWRHSFDMLGEGAVTRADAERHFEAYREAIDAVAAGWADVADEEDRAGISIKLSALHPRYEFAQRARVMDELAPRVAALGQQAAARGVALTIDAEEHDRFDLSLAIADHVLATPGLSGWHGFGMAVQAYRRRAPEAIDRLLALARQRATRLHVRLVKGAYWDTEIKRAQEQGLPTYPVFTRKVSTDVAWLACARRLFAEDAAVVYPQFATHNAHSVAYVLAMAAGSARPFEFQRLHGMGEALYSALAAGPDRVPCRIYAPVGTHDELLPYLVRRLLENGANTSFVNRILDEALPPEEIARDPVAVVDALDPIPHPGIPDPPAMFDGERRNSAGIDLSDGRATEALERAMAPHLARRDWRAAPQGSAGDGTARAVINPARHDDVVGTVIEAAPAAAVRALDRATAHFDSWEATPAATRAAHLRHAAEAFEAAREELMALCVREAGRTLPAALAEVREAVDFLRYYAHRCEVDFGAPRRLPGPTGESNELVHRGRGPFVCISPWNFPLSIFTGQVAAALAAGNTVIAKPAEQTPLVAARAVELLAGAGIPSGVLSLVPGDGERIGAALLSDPRVAGVAFTGSTAVARHIHRQLAARDAPLAVLIAETGGQNAMVVDSSALPEQVVRDAVTSAFDSAGQRCSALRLLFLQEDIADRVIDGLRGAMDELVVGDPSRLATDVGPVINGEARSALEDHLARLAPRARWVHRAPLDPSVAAAGTWFAPAALEIGDPAELTQEVFGPVLHVVRWAGRDLDRVIDAINATGYGLTLGVHSRIEATARRIADRARVGNVYVNRNIIGAVVGVQPFGGRGLSGTGPKAGGPHYLPRFGTERTLTVNTAALGGNAGLLSLDGG